MSRTVLFGPFPPPYGGVASYLQTLSEALRERSIPCAIKPFRDREGSGVDDVAPSFSSVWRHFRSLRADDVCVDSCSFFIEYPHFFALVAWFLCRTRIGFRWIKVVHDGSLPARYREFSRRQRLIARLAAASADHIVAVSEPLRDWCVGALGVPDSRISVIGSLLPLPRYTDDVLPHHVEQVLTSEGVRVVCATGTFTRDYGFDQIATAVERLRDALAEDLQLLLLDPGFGTEDNGFRALVTDGRPWVTVVSALRRPAVLALLRRSSALVRGTRYESVGLSRIEGLLCGVPVIVTRTGETRGMLVYDYGNVDALSSLLAAALESPRAHDAGDWIDRFRAEAQRNLDRLLAVIAPGEALLSLQAQ